jgi:hypothetical protein
MYKLFLGVDMPSETNPFMPLFDYLMTMPNASHAYYCDGEKTPFSTNADRLTLTVDVNDDIKNAFATMLQYLKTNRNFNFDVNFYSFGFSSTPLKTAGAN